MSRRRAAEKREVMPDTVYNDIVVTKFINFLMRKGKKGVAQKIFYTSLDKAIQRAKTTTKDKGKDKEKVTSDNTGGIAVLQAALNNVKPYFEVKSRRVGGSTYQIPVEVKSDRKLTLAIRWIINASKTRNGKSMIDKLSGELLDAYNNRGGAVKKKEEIHKMAEANRAFSHYAWYGR